MILIYIIVCIIYFVALPMIHGFIGLLINLINPKYYVLIGFSIKNKNITYNFKINILNDEYHIKKKVGNFIFTNDKNIFVYPKLLGSRFYNIRTVFSLRLLGKIENDSIKLKVKISLFSIIHLILTFLGLISIIIWSLITTQDIIIPIAGFLFLVLLTMGYAQIYFAMEDNYESMIDELNEIITTQYNL